MTFDFGAQPGYFALFLIATILGSGAFATIIVKLLERERTKALTSHELAQAGESEARATDVLVKAGEVTVSMLQDELLRAYARIRELEARVEVLEQQVHPRPGGRRVGDPPLSDSE